MTFYSAFNSLADGMAMKRPSWTGYIKRADHADPGQTSGVTNYAKFDLIFRPRTGESVVTYTYTYVTRGSEPIVEQAIGATTQTIDLELMAGLTSDDWLVSTVAQFEDARVGSGAW